MDSWQTWLKLLMPHGLGSISNQGGYKLSFLSKFGSVLHKVDGVLTKIYPLAGFVGQTVESFLPAGSTAQQDVEKIIAPGGFLDQGSALIQTGEAFGQALGIAGPDKLKAASGPMAQLILQSTTFSGKKIKNPDLFKQGATKIADGLADCWNAVDESEVKVQNLPS